MPVYRVMMRGEYFALHLNGRWKLFGFHTSREVEAETMEEAEQMAVRMVMRDEPWADTRPRAGFPTPRIYPEFIYRMEEPSFEDEGYAFFPMNKAHA